MPNVPRLLDRLLLANADPDRVWDAPNTAMPREGLAIVTCMDARIAVFGVFGLQLGDAHIIRNAGGRVTDDVLRSLGLSSQVLGTDTVVLLEHTRCGLHGVTDEELRIQTGADIDFRTIADHKESLVADIEVLAQTPFLDRIHTIAGLLLDIDTGRVDELVRWNRPGT